MSYLTNLNLVIRLTVARCQRSLEQRDNLAFSEGVKSLERLRRRQADVEWLEHLNRVSMLNCYREGREFSFCLIGRR